MNEQALAILNGAVAQLRALEQATQTQIDADSSDALSAQAKLDADNADIATQRSALGAQQGIEGALTALIAQYGGDAPAP